MREFSSDFRLNEDTMKKKKKGKRRIGLWVALALAGCALIFIGIMALNASVLHLRRATVTIEDLPPAFEGMTILYAADLDLKSEAEVRRAAAAFQRLEVLEPDLLVLGGDYTSPTLMDLINQSPPANAPDLRRDFFYYISDFQTSLGKVMIAAPDDIPSDDLSALAAQTGFTLLDHAAATLRLGSDAVHVVGLGQDYAGFADLSRRFSQQDCVIALAWSPAQFPAVMISEAGDSGHWVDLALAGHTHGGQINLFGHSILSLDQREKQYLYGWDRETGVPLLTTSGMGCEGVELRLGSQSEVWLITLMANRNA